MIKRSIGVVFVILFLISIPWVPASSFFVSETKADVGAVDYVTTSTGDTGLIVTEDGITLSDTASGTGLAHGKYWFGSRDNPTDVFAFTFTHHVEENPDLTVRFDSTVLDTDAVTNVEFSVFDSRGVFIGSVSEHERALTFNGGPEGSTYYVVVMIDTHGASTEEDIRGVFSVTI